MSVAFGTGESAVAQELERRGWSVDRRCARRADPPGDYDYEDDVPEEEVAERPRDPKTDEAKAKALQLVGQQPRRVFYQRQIEVLLEKEIFHWVTVRALGELVEEGALESVVLALGGGRTKIRFFWRPGQRYWKREAAKISKLVLEFSRLGRAIGMHGETMFDAALPRFGFMPKARKVREYGGRQWTETGHDLDRVFERDEIAYGAEIKNTLVYIPREEMRLKVRMCGELGLKPLFIVRMAAKSYIEEVRGAGGFTLVFKYQLYPHGQKELAERVRKELGLPVDCPERVEDGTVLRFLGWHRREHGLGDA